MKINTDPKIIDEILSRSIKTIYPSKESLKTELLSGRQLRIYVGIDPTAIYVHIGHSTNYILLQKFHELGHKIIVLIGDFTAMIGDPSDKTSLRKKLSFKEVRENLKTFRQQIGKIVKLNDKKNPVQFSFNSKWLTKLSFGEVMGLASNFTVQQMIERDAFQKRIRENKPLYLHEFFYPLMQGYDSVAMDVDIEIGGTDQIFNMLAGRILVKNLQKREKFVIATTLLENPATGEKLMSKSLGTGIALNDSPSDMYGKTMRLPDEAIAQCFIDCTFWSLNKINKKMSTVKNGSLGYRDFKMLLAYEIVKIYHGEKKAKIAQESFINTFQKKEVDIETIPEIETSSGELLVEILLRNKSIASKGEFRRLLTEGAIHNIGTKERVTDPHLKITNESAFKIGKKRFIKIVIK